MFLSLQLSYFEFPTIQSEDKIGSKIHLSSCICQKTSILYVEVSYFFERIEEKNFFLLKKPLTSTYRMEVFWQIHELRWILEPILSSDWIVGNSK